MRLPRPSANSPTRQGAKRANLPSSAIAFGSFFEKSEKVGRVRALGRTYAAKIGGALAPEGLNSHKSAFSNRIPQGLKPILRHCCNVRAEARTLQWFKCDCPGLPRLRTSLMCREINRSWPFLVFHMRTYFLAGFCRSLAAVPMFDVAQTNTRAVAKLECRESLTIFKSVL